MSLFPELDTTPDAVRPDAPLAERMRPRALDEIVGQAALLAPGAFLRRVIEGDRMPSLILWGPPGSGKTTLARLIARLTRHRFLAYSAVNTGVKEVKAVLEDSVRRRRAGERTILFLDEVHRFNRSQQDALLPYVESGDVVFIGATTENPSFEVNGALLSRCRVVVLEALAPESIAGILERALTDSSRGLGSRGLQAGEGALAAIAELSSGDARAALNILEATAEGLAAGAALTREGVYEVVQRRALLYDKGGEEHFNIISALHKSMRNSDVDASLYWLARMLEAGEDPLYVARRVVRFASEDVGLADPQALPLAMAAKEAVHFLGMPEGNLALAQAVAYCALAPKSNALYAAYGEIRADVARTYAEPVPLHLRNAATGLMKEVGYGAGYRYAHDFDERVAQMRCLPESLAEKRYYQPRHSGFERELGRRMEELRVLQQDGQATTKAAG